MILITGQLSGQSYLETGVFYSKTIKEWVNIDDIQAITDIGQMATMEGGYFGPELPAETWQRQGQYYFIIKYKTRVGLDGCSVKIYHPQKSEAERLHDDFVSIWKKYKSHQRNKK